MLVALMAAVPAHAAKRRDFVGIASDDTFHGSSAYRAANFRAQHRAGVQIIRQNFDWASIERSPATYRFGEYDAYVAAAANAGLRILPVLHNPPRFRSSAPRSGARRGEYPPSDPNSMGAFARALVQRYGPSGSFWRSHPKVRKVPIRSWQVWNEPSLPVYWQPGPNPAAYARLLRVVRGYIRSTDRKAEVVTAGIPFTQLKSAFKLTTFLRLFYKAGGKSGFNTLAVNAYSTDNRQLKKTLKAVRKVMRRYGDRRKKLWITELGWATAGPRHRLNVGSRGQARKIGSALKWIKRNRGKLRIRGLVYFQWRDQRPYPPMYKDMWGLHTGLVTAGNRRKRSLATFRRAAKRLR